MACHGAASIYGRQESAADERKEEKQENGLIDSIWILLSAVGVTMMAGARGEGGACAASNRGEYDVDGYAV